MNPTNNLDDPDFEGYRRDRKRRHLAAGPKRDLGRHPSVLRELELAEQEEMRNEQMSREVNDFFSDATRTAAEIVARVAEAEEQALAGSVSGDMAEFLNGTISRAQSLIEFLRQKASMSNVSTTDIEPMVHNIVGPQLDEFRHQGTAELADKHIGQDPFATELESIATGDRQVASPAANDPATTAAPEVEMHEHLAATAVEDEPEVEVPAPTDHVFAWMSELRDDPKRLTDSLRLLVANGLMSKDEAIGIYRELK